MCFEAYLPLWVASLKYLICQILFTQMLEGLVKKIALDFDVLNIAKAAKGSKEAKIAEVGSDIELLTKQS